METSVGRTIEEQKLRECLTSSRSELVAIYGRRRVGKTFLVRSFFKNKFTFSFVGAYGAKAQVQLENFRVALNNYGAVINEKLENWSVAFRRLAELIESSTDQRKVVFFDEMPWMDSKGKDFLSSFEYFWNSWASRRDDILFIICGSATSWMKENIEQNRGGLHNRITQHIYLRPFTLKECAEYLRLHGMEWDEYDLIRCYMTLGGVPYYLSLLDSHLSLIQNVDHLFFERNAVLRNEFDELYNALFNKADRYLKVVSLLATKREGMTRNEVEQGTGMSGGSLTTVLRNLEHCDFISAYNQYGNRSKMAIYKLTDFYSIFYLRFVANTHSFEEHYWEHRCMSRAVESWYGYTFEHVCLAHIENIKSALGISGMATTASAWRFVPTKESGLKGAQIDLVISRADRITHLCEIKYSTARYVIDKDYAMRLRERRELFMEQTGTRNGVLITFITPFGLAENKYSSLVHSSLTADDVIG